MDKKSKQKGENCSYICYNNFASSTTLRDISMIYIKKIWYLFRVSYLQKTREPFQTLSKIPTGGGIL